MLDSLAELTKTLFVPGTLTFLLFGLTIGVILLWLPGRSRRAGALLLTILSVCYWLASIPVVADLLASRMHARSSGPATADDLVGVKAIVVLGAGVRNTYMAGGHLVPVPDAQTVFNAVEGARIYQLFPDGLPVIASGGQQPEARAEATESLILKEWLVKAGVPAERIVLESGSKNTREQAQLVAPLLKTNHWERFALVTPAVQGPRAATVFRLQGVDPVSASAPFWEEKDRGKAPGWIPNGGALRASERAMYDYLAWAYYWMRGWLR